MRVEELEEKIDQAHLDGTCRTTTFFYELLESGDLETITDCYNSYSGIDEEDNLDRRIEIANSFDSLITALNNFHGDNWDIRYCNLKLPKKRILELNGGLKLYIHYPEFDITNENGKTHTIRDLYITLNISINTVSNSISLINMQGFRTTLTFAEVVSTYVHSHLPGLNTTFFPEGILDNDEQCTDTMNEAFITKHFCKGVQTEIDIFLLGTTSTDFKMDEDTATLFLYILDDYVKWESLKGSPYRHICNISEERCLQVVSRELPDSYTVAVAKEFLNEFAGSLVTLKFKENNNRVVLIEDKETKMDLLNNFIKYTDIYNNNLEYLIDMQKTNEAGLNKNYSSLKGSSMKTISVDKSINTSIVFRDTNLVLKIEKPLSRTGESVRDSVKIHPDVYKKIIKLINIKANEYGRSSI